MKKVFSIMLVAATLTALLPATALAHGHGGGHHRSAQRQHKVCTVEDCSYTTNHEHDAVTYCAHYAGDGHSYHESSAHGHGRH